MKSASPAFRFLLVTVAAATLCCGHASAKDAQTLQDRIDRTGALFANHQGVFIVADKLDREKISEANFIAMLGQDGEADKALYGKLRALHATAIDIVTHGVENKNSAAVGRLDHQIQEAEAAGQALAQKSQLALIQFGATPGEATKRDPQIDYAEAFIQMLGSFGDDYVKGHAVDRQIGAVGVKEALTAQMQGKFPLLDTRYLDENLTYTAVTSHHMHAQIEAGLRRGIKGPAVMNAIVEDMLNVEASQLCLRQLLSPEYKRRYMKVAI